MLAAPLIFWAVANLASKRSTKRRDSAPNLLLTVRPEPVEERLLVQRSFDRLRTNGFGHSLLARRGDVVIGQPVMTVNRNAAVICIIRP